MGIVGILLLLSLGYEASIAEWRKTHEQGWRAQDGYLAITGLFWLKEGANTVGSDPSSDITLPAGLPSRAGVIDFRGGKAVYQPVGGPSRTLNPDSAGTKEIVSIGRVNIYLIQRAGRSAIRMQDPESELLRSFKGVSWFPVRPEYRVEARFHTYEPPRTLQIANVVGLTEPMPSPGYVEFRLHGQVLRLDAIGKGKSLFFVFRDRTSGRQTYGSGRFLNSDLPKDGKVVLDFNKAYNPPCAYNPYTTCPLPPKQNHLPIAVEAGALAYSGTER